LIRVQSFLYRVCIKQEAIEARIIELSRLIKNLTDEQLATAPTAFIFKIYKYKKLIGANPSRAYSVISAVIFGEREFIRKKLGYPPNRYSVLRIPLVVMSTTLIALGIIFCMSQYTINIFYKLIVISENINLPVLVIAGMTFIAVGLVTLFFTGIAAVLYSIAKYFWSKSSSPKMFKKRKDNTRQKDLSNNPNRKSRYTNNS
jgi:hypothetical protein